MITISKKEFNKLYLLACPTWKTKFKQKFEDFMFSDNLEFEESFLDEMEQACDANQLKVFKEIFKSYVKEDLFSIKTYSEVCKRLSIKELTIKDFKQFGEDSEKMLAFHQIKNIERLFNGNWITDWKNTSQYKYYPYFTINNSGGLVFHDSDYIGSYCSGVVAFYKDFKTAEFVGKTFIDIYNILK